MCVPFTVIKNTKIEGHKIVMTTCCQDHTLCSYYFYEEQSLIASTDFCVLGKETWYPMPAVSHYFQEPLGDKRSPQEDAQSPWRQEDRVWSLRHEVRCFSQHEATSGDNSRRRWRQGLLVWLVFTCVYPQRLATGSSKAGTQGLSDATYCWHPVYASDITLNSAV